MNIKTNEELQKYLKYEKKLYFRYGLRDTLIKYVTSSPAPLIYKYVKLLRKTEFFYNQNRSLYRNFMYFYYRRKKNVLGQKLGIEMYENTFDSGLMIWHSNGIVVNSSAVIGKNCCLHGRNCIGNNGKDNLCPIIGDNVDIGVGASIIGNVKIADNVTIGANSVVVSDILVPGCTVVGIPGRPINIVDNKKSNKHK